MRTSGIVVCRHQSHDNSARHTPITTSSMTSGPTNQLLNKPEIASDQTH